MSGTRQEILDRLRAAPASDSAIREPSNQLEVDPFDEASTAELEARFVEEATKAGVVVKATATEAEALSELEAVVAGERLILGWSVEHVPLPAYDTWLASAKIELVQEPRDGVKIGITGAEAALSTTGSLVLFAGPGRSRSASLLPETHVAVLKRDRIVANLESWLRLQRQTGVEAVRAASNVVIITGPSRTADIGMELVMGAHGPRRMHVILV